MRTIIWSDFASTRLKEIYDFYKNKAGSKVANKVIANIYKSTDRLIEQPLSGQTEENLISLNLEHRYVISGHTKVIYRLVDTHTILVTDAFDTRQNPLKMEP